MTKRFKKVGIRSIRREPLSVPVYNLAVAGNESYVADGVVVHNCRSILVPVTIALAPAEEDYISDADKGEAFTLADNKFTGKQAGKPRPKAK